MSVLKIALPFFLCLLCTNAFSQVENFKEEDVTRIPIDHAKRYPEIYLNNESVLKHKDSKTGIITDEHYTGKETNRFSASYLGSSDYTNFTDVTSFDVQYQFKASDYLQTWWAFQFKRTTGKYNKIADELEDESDHPQADSKRARLANTQSITSLGIGGGYRFKLLFAFNESERFFEHITAFANYNTANDSTTGKNYTGWGYNADYSLLYRSGNSLFYGLKLSYNVTAVVRPASTDEPKKDRSLTYGWTSIGFEIGYYY